MNDQVVVDPLILPILVLVFWTFIVLVCNLSLRIYLVLKLQKVHPYFKVFQGAPPAGRFLQWKNHLQNLFEVPVLFYVIGLLHVSQMWQDPVVQILAWFYVVLRMAHSVIHMTYNYVPHRVLPFVLSNIVLVVMYFKTVARVLA